MAEGGLQNETVELIEFAIDRGGVYVSPISAWELGMLIAKGRLALKRDASILFREMTETRLRLAPLEPDVLIASTALPYCDLRDPADRIIAATARAYLWHVVTRDRPLLAYAEAGWVRAVPC